ncbi:MAG: metal ABC transporter substrate-binding protein [Promethearchaeota archaeon]
MELNIKPSDTSLSIIASITIVQDIVQNIMGESVPVIVDGTEDPHSYEPTPSEMTSLADADIIFRMGPKGLEPWWKKDWEDAKVVQLVKSDMMKPDPVMDNIKNPHVWMDPTNVKTFTTEVKNVLCAADPSNAAIFSANAKKYMATLDSLLNDINKRKNDLEGTKVVVNHPAFFYLFQKLGIIRLDAVEQGEGKEPSAEDIAQIIDVMTEENCQLMITDPQHETENVYEIARNTGSKISTLTPLLNVKLYINGVPVEVKSYEQMIRINLLALLNPSNPPIISTTFLTTFVIIGIATIALVVVFTIIRIR